MPIHLPPLSRRRFITRTLAAGAAAALSPHLLAASRSRDSHSWALLSDSHLAADRASVFRGVNMTDHFLAVRQEVLALPKRPAGLFLSGDCAYNSGAVGDYAVLADLVTAIREDQVPVHLALGNHDHRERFWDAFPAEKAAQRPVHDRQTALLRAGRANWFLLDSLETTQSTPGLLGPDQLSWLGRALDDNRKEPALVMLHHNPGNSSGVSGLKDTEALFEVIRPRKQVKALIFGHTHDWNVVQDSSGIHLINLPPVGYVFKDGKPSGWFHATLEKQGMRLQLSCVDHSHPNHGEVLNLQWRPA
jgi:3',5'-cyclic AMP phosphodiesterase CpdA